MNVKKMTEYTDKLMEFVTGEEIKAKRPKAQEAKPKDLGVGHLSSEKGQDVKAGDRVYASANKK